MAVGHVDRSRRRFGSVIDALFRDARELERRRRRRYLLLILSGYALAAGVGLLIGAGANSPPVLQSQAALYRVTGSSGPPSAALLATTSGGAHSGGGRITLSGRVGPLQLDRSTRADVVRFAGEPDATGRGNFHAIPHRPNYFALGYSCQGSDDDGLGIVDRSAYCKTVFYINSRTERVVGFHTSSPAYSFNGASPGAPAPQARRQTHRAARSGCLTGFFFFNRRNHASLFGEVDGGRATPHGQGANPVQRISGGHLEALELESNRHPVGLLFC